LYVPKLVDKTDRTAAEYKKIARSKTDVIDARKNVGDGSVIALNVGYRLSDGATPLESLSKRRLRYQL
jgi:hypothetical protein